MESMRASVRRTALLSLPIVMEGLLQTAVSYVDTAMVGRLGPAQTAAVAVCTPMLWMLNGAAMAISVGATVWTARHIGAQEPHEAGRISHQAFLLSGVYGLLCAALYFALSFVLPALMGAAPDVRPDAAAYMRILSPAFVLNYMAMVLYGVLRGAGDTLTPMWAAIATNLLNVVGNYLLIYPTHAVTVLGRSFTIVGAGMGVAGAALSTALSMALSGGLVIALLFRRLDAIRLPRQGLFRLDWPICRKILNVGLPAAGERLSISGGQVVFQAIITRLGTLAIASHYLAVTAESISYMPVNGLSAAATTLVGQSLGAGEERLASRYGNVACALCLGLSALAGAVLFFVPHVLMAPFSTDRDVLSLGAELLRIVAISQPLMALANVGSGALRGAGDTRWPFYISAFTMWVVRLSVGCLCAFGLRMGVQGAWLGMIADLILRGALVGARWFRGRWRSDVRARFGEAA